MASNPAHSITESRCTLFSLWLFALDFGHESHRRSVARHCRSPKLLCRSPPVTSLFALRRTSLATAVVDLPLSTLTLCSRLVFR
ncbi:hypothetical protein ACOSQ4_006912 [Xanthoceras sorbifolium]